MSPGTCLIALQICDNFLQLFHFIAAIKNPVVFLKQTKKMIKTDVALKVTYNMNFTTSGFMILREISATRVRGKKNGTGFLKWVWGGVKGRGEGFRTTKTANRANFLTFTSLPKLWGPTAECHICNTLQPNAKSSQLPRLGSTISPHSSSLPIPSPQIILSR